MQKVGVSLFLFAAIGFGQVNGRIAGSVVDPTGAAVPNATVEVKVPGGAQAIFASKTNEAGLFSFTAMRPGTYDVLITVPGFAKSSTRQVAVGALSVVGLNIKLELAATDQILEVQADAQAVQLTSNELSATVTRQQLELLPTASRQVSTLFVTQAGVNNGRGPTVINGLRTSAANVTIDGINVQDNFIRTNSLDFMPFRPTIAQISEVAIAVGNAASSVGGGAAQVSIITRSGSNEYHGEAYWFNQNSKFAANEFFNNRSGVSIPFLNQNQPGLAASGRIIRDKLFFFANWEDVRLKQQTSVLRTVLTPSARNGIFTYRGGPNVNILQTKGIQIDPAIAASIQALPLPNSTDVGDGLNTGGYRFNARSNSDRRQYVTRWDYYLTSSHNLATTYNFTHEDVDRPTLTTRFYTPIPPNANTNNSHLNSTSWRWTVTPTLTNEVRGGFALSPGLFQRRDEVPATFYTGSIFTAPVNEFMPQGRNTNTYSIQDNASWLKGRHEFSFGFQTQFIRTDPYNDGGIVPTYTLGISAANTTGFTPAQLPGATTADVNLANNLYATLGGIISASTQTFNVNSPTSGFVNRATNQRKLSYDTYSGYFQDRWKVNSRLTLGLGLRYEYWTVLKEKDNLFLLPALKNGNFIDTLADPLATFDFIGVGGRKAYNPDRNNFAPNIGLAFDPTGHGKTSIRAGYSISFFNDEAITTIRNNLTTNAGLSTGATQAGLVARLAAAPPVPVPAYKVPRTQADNYAVDTSAAIAMPDPSLRTPYAQQYSLSIQHELKGNLFELRYVGNHATKLLRGADFNQVDIRSNGFLADFNRARNNAFLSGAAFNPNFSGPGSQPLTVFPRLGSGGLLTNATVLGLIRQGAAGELANVYQTNGLKGELEFYRNRNALGANAIINGGDSTYNALQFDVRRRMSRGLQMQANYTFGKVLSNTAGDAQARFEPFLDQGNNALERSRPSFDLTHSIKANGSYALPFGKNQRWAIDNKVVDHILGGWQIGGLLSWQSGFPFSVNSNRGTLNRGGRSTNLNTANSPLTKQQLDDTVFGLRKAGDGVFFIAPGAIGPDSRGVATDGGPLFSGQAFTNPGPGDVGGLQRRMFSGPWNFGLNMSLGKRFTIRERHSIEFRADAFNVPNTPGFTIGDQDINVLNFGRITAVDINSRTTQFGLHYRF